MTEIGNETINIQGHETKDYGIEKVFKFTKKRKVSKTNEDKIDLITVDKDAVQTLVKVAFTMNNVFVLLSDGRLLSRGKSDCLGRDNDEYEGISKKFKEVSFVDVFVKNDIVVSELRSYVAIFSIATGDNHVLVVDNSYHAWGWGSNQYGQVNPETINIASYSKPIKIEGLAQHKIARVFAHQNSSMALGKNTKIFVWGAIEGYIGNFKGKSKQHTEIITLDKITSLIQESMIKDFSDDLTENFLDSQKWHNPKYVSGATLGDVDTRLRLDALAKKIKNLKLDIQERKNQTKQITLAVQLKTNDKKIIMLQKLLKVYEDKLARTSAKKDEIRKALISIEEEISQKNSDLNLNNEQIDRIQDQIEQIHNELGEMNSKQQKNKYDKQSEYDMFLRIDENLKKLKSLETLQESLFKNLNMILCYIDEKNKERFSLSDVINSLYEKENNYLSIRLILEDMILILHETLTAQAVKERKDAFDSSVDLENTAMKVKEKQERLLKLLPKLDEISFVEMSRNNPFKLVEDIVNESNKELKAITKEVENIKSTISEMVKVQLKVTFNLIDTKINLITEQNYIITQCYSYLVNIDSNYIKALLELEKNEYNFETTSKEYLHKALILKTLKEADKTIEYERPVEQEPLKEKKFEYFDNKLKQYDLIEHRDNLSNKIDELLSEVEEIVSFGYTKEERSFTWGYTSVAK